MRGLAGREPLEAAARSAAETVTLADLAATALPLLKRGLGSTFAHIIKFSADGTPRGVVGDTEQMAPDVYFRDFFAHDPITAVNARVGFAHKIIVPSWHLERGT